MLLFREKVPASWLPKVLANLPAVLVDHAHLERKAATSALNLEKYRDLFPRVEELNAIAIEELQHFQLVLDLLKRRGIPFGQPYPSPWIGGLMKSVRNGQRHQVIELDLLQPHRKPKLREVSIPRGGTENEGPRTGRVLRRPCRIRRQPLCNVSVDGQGHKRVRG